MLHTNICEIITMLQTLVISHIHTTKWRLINDCLQTDLQIMSIDYLHVEHDISNTHCISALFSLSRRWAVSVVPGLHLSHQLSLDISAVQRELPTNKETRLELIKSHYATQRE